MSLNFLISPARLKDLGILGMNRRNASYIGRFNARSRFPLVDNKLNTKLLAAEHGIATPALRFVLNTQIEVRRSLDRFAELPGFAVKPAKGSGGKGILVIREQKEGRFIKSSGVKLTRDDLQRHLSNILAGLHSLAGVPDAVLVEDLIRSDPGFAQLSHEGIPDIRIIVFRGYPVMAMLRLATRASDGKANLHQGAVGVGLDLATGRGIRAIQFERPVSSHPDTGEPLTEIRIPGWRQLLLMAARCHEMTGLGYIGADIVLDRDRGPLLLELNARPGLSIQLANGRGLRPRLEHLAGLAGLAEKAPGRVEARVDYAMQVFRADGPL